MSVTSHEQALAHYLMLGPGRSLKKLRQHYAGLTPPKPVSIDTLKFWSRRHGWMSKAAAHDQEVAQRLVEKSARERTKSEWNQVEALLSVARRCLELLKEAHLGVVTTAQDCRTFISGAVEATKMAEVLTGGFSDRVARQQPERTDEAIKSLEEIERRLRGVANKPPTDAA